MTARHRRARRPRLLRRGRLQAPGKQHVRRLRLRDAPRDGDGALGGGGRDLVPSGHDYQRPRDGDDLAQYTALRK
jgi:hypothetical protein